jgi:hypothetical protein
MHVFARPRQEGISEDAGAQMTEARKSMKTRQ